MYLDLKDRYGEPGDGLCNLMYVAVIKNSAAECGAVAVDINLKNCAVHFDNNVFKNENVIFAVSDMSDECSFEIKENPLVFLVCFLITINLNIFVFAIPCPCLVCNNGIGLICYRIG